MTEEEIKAMQEEIAKLKEDAEKAKVKDDPPIVDDKVKENIKKAYEERDAAKKEADELKSKVREAELKALEESGKKDVADKMRMEELQEQLKASDDRITTLTRDNELRTHLANMDFVSEKASTIAYNDIVVSLIQDAQGIWVSPTGQSIAEYTEFYKNDESNKFLFKVKQSSGSNSMTGNNTPPGTIDTNKSITEMTDAEMLAAAAEGKFDKSGRFI